MAFVAFANLQTHTQFADEEKKNLVGDEAQRVIWNRAD
jgi:hypothetical protein